MQALLQQQKTRHQRQSVFVRNFPSRTSESDLQAALSCFGVVSKILLDKSSVSESFVCEVHG